MDVIRLSKTFQMLSNPLRLRILQHLGDCDKLLVTTLALALEVRPSVVSHHLKLMESYYLVKRIPAGKYAYYQINVVTVLDGGKISRAIKFLEGLG